MADLKPIETIYNGNRFRSRLEARWAVYFDLMGVQYQYEPEGFVLENGVYYLPDFYLTECDCYVEIKPIGALDIKYDVGAESVRFKDGFESANKYIEALANICNCGHDYMVLEGDPYDLLCDKSSKGFGAYWTLNGVCKIKAVTTWVGGDDIDCSCGITPFQCTKSFPTMLTFNGFCEGKLIAVCNAKTDKVVVMDEKYQRIIFFREDAWFINDVICTNQSFFDNFKSATRARQTRFEHGAVDIPDNGYTSRARELYTTSHFEYKSLNRVESSIIGILYLNPELCKAEVDGKAIEISEMPSYYGMLFLAGLQMADGKNGEIKFEDQDKESRCANVYISAAKHDRMELTKNDFESYIAYVRYLREKNQMIEIERAEKGGDGDEKADS